MNPATSLLRFFLVDAFAAGPFTGNPAVVMLLEHWPEESWLQHVAMEMNQAETAYVVPEGEGFRLRWFTPTIEVNLCGHATLASAHVLWQSGIVPLQQPVDFWTRSGKLTAAAWGEQIQLDFPLDPATPAAAPEHLFAGLNVAERPVWKNRFDYLVELETECEVRALRPDFHRLGQVACRGVIVTARSADDRVDFVSRFFGPASGIDEDPATGSAYCCLGEYWRTRLGKSSFSAYQASRRGGYIDVEVTHDRALLRGRAFTIAKGELVTSGS